MQRSNGVAHLILAATVAVTLIAPPVLALATGPARATAPVLIVTPPWRDAEVIARAAGGRIVALERAPMATMAVFDDPQSLARLRASGAWALVDGRAIAALCGVQA